MKKLLTIALLTATTMATAVFANAAPSANSEPQLWESPQQTRRINQTTRYNRRGARVVTRTRIVRVGYRSYRETIQIKYLPNGRTQTRVLSRTRIR